MAQNRGICQTGRRGMCAGDSPGHHRHGSTPRQRPQNAPHRAFSRRGYRHPPHSGTEPQTAHRGAQRPHRGRGGAAGVQGRGQSRKHPTRRHRPRRAAHRAQGGTVTPGRANPPHTAPQRPHRPRDAQPTPRPAGIVCGRGNGKTRNPLKNQGFAPRRKIF